MDTTKRSKFSSVLALAGFGGATAAAAALGSVATRNNMGLWYRLLRKPSFQPPRAAFPIVWTALYAMIAASGWRVWRRSASPERSRALALWSGQLGLNAAWTWLFFDRKLPRAAFADIVALLSATIAYANEARKIDRPAAGLVAPYAAWLTFAGALNLRIVQKNGWTRG